MIDLKRRYNHIINHPLSVVIIHDVYCLEQYNSRLCLKQYNDKNITSCMSDSTLITFYET